MSISKAKLHKLIQDKRWGAKRIQRLLEKPDLLLSTILLGNNLVNIGASALATGLFIHWFGDVGMVYATAIMTACVLIFSEVLPKTIANLHPFNTSQFASIPMQIIIRIFYPVTLALKYITWVLIRLLGLNPDKGVKFTENDVRGAIGLGLAAGVLKRDEQQMLNSILDLEHITVADVMVHRSAIDSLDINLPLDKIITNLSNHKHSRVPVWEDKPDNIIGILLVKDFFFALQDTKSADKFDMRSILQPAYFVPESISIHQQLFEFKRLRRHLALVIDEYGGLLGILSLEDIIEEIVGEIDDEHDSVTAQYKTLPDGSVNVVGNMAVRDINKVCDWDLPETEAVTIAGLMLDELGHIPLIGEHVELESYTLTVLGRKRQTITKIKITPSQEPENKAS